jgi:putative phosphoesterase
MMKIGILGDIHGDLRGFNTALRIFESEGVDFTICAGDIVERGSDADEVVRLIREHNINCIKGNHEYSVISNQKRWRQTDNYERMVEIGRIISDETVAYLERLPDSAQFDFENTRITVAHGTPWSDVIAVFPDSRQGIFDQLFQRYSTTTDVMILGHTHQPMRVHMEPMLIINPGSIYGVTIRDSHTCATLSLPEQQFQVFDLETEKEFEIATVYRSV